MQILPEYAECGYQEKDGTVAPVLSNLPAAAPELLDELICGCNHDQCNGEQYHCFMNEQPCIAACGCEACTDTIEDVGLGVIHLLNSPR